MKKSLLLLILFFPLLTNCWPPAIMTTTPQAKITQMATEFPITSPQMEINKTDAPEPTTILENPSGIIQLPEWLKSPGESEISIANGCPDKENCQLILVNPANQARYNLPVNDVAVYFWLPGGKGIGLITNSHQFMNFTLATEEKDNLAQAVESEIGPEL